MSSSAAVARILENITPGLVTRASEHVKQRSFKKTGIRELDHALAGGWVQGRLNILRSGGSASAGRTTVATATVADVTASGYLVAWIDGDGSMDPVTVSRAGADLNKILWIRGPLTTDQAMKSADLIISSSLFSVVVIRPAGEGASGGGSTRWMRLSRAADLSGSTVLVLEKGGMLIPDAASVLNFAPMRPEWTGKWGYGVLDGAAIKTTGDLHDHDKTEYTFSSKTAWQGFVT